MRYFDRPTETMPREQLQSLQLEKLRAMLDQLYGRNRFYTAKLDELRPYFTHAQFVVLPEFGHVGDVENLQPEAFERLTTSYYDTGVADASLFEYEPLSFKPGLGLPTMAGLLVAAMIIVPLLLVGGVVLIIRRIRKRRASVAA